MTKEDLRILMGKNIRTERLRRGMCIDELASVMELTPGFMGLIERGRRGATAHNLHRLVQVFNIKVDTLFQSDDKTAAAIEEEEMTNVLRRKINSMIVGLTEKEMFFVINQIKGIREMNHTYKPNDSDED